MREGEGSHRSDRVAEAKSASLPPSSLTFDGLRAHPCAGAARSLPEASFSVVIGKRPLAGVGSFVARACYALARRDISRLAPFVHRAMVHEYFKNTSSIIRTRRGPKICSN